MQNSNAAVEDFDLRVFVSLISLPEGSFFEASTWLNGRTFKGLARSRTTAIALLFQEISKHHLSMSETKRNEAQRI